MAGMAGVIATIIGWVGYHLGQRTDAADAAGSLHGKAGQVLAEATNIKDKIGTSSDTRANNTVLGWLNSPIKSIQRGTITIANAATSGTATISSVGASKSMVFWLGTRTVNEPTLLDSMVTVTLTNATTVTATRSGNVGVIYINYQVVEYY